MKKIVTLTLMVALLFCSGFSLFQKSKYIWHKNQFSYVKLENVAKEMGKLDQPAEISPEQWKAILTSIKYTRSWLNMPGTIGKKTNKEFDLLLPDEAAQLTGYMSKAFHEANSGQLVDFSLEAVRGQFLIGTDRLVDGLAFVKNGKLNLVFRNIGESIGGDEKVNLSDPFKYYPGSSRLVPKAGQELGKNKKGVVMYNWLVIDLKPAPTPEAPEAPVAGEEKKAEPAATTLPETKAAPAAPAQSETKAKPAPAPAAKEQPAKSVKERLTELRDLYDKGFINEEEYNKKRKEILDSL